MAGRDDFEARLRRLEQKAATQDAETLTAPNARQANTKKSTKAPLNPGMGNRLAIVLGFIALIGIALLAAWQFRQSPFQIVPTQLKDSLVSAEGWLSGSAPDPAETGPADPRVATRLQTHQGWSFESPGVANRGFDPLIMGDVTTGFDPALEVLAPQEFTVFEANSECRVRIPSQGDIVHNIRLESGNSKTQAHAFSTAAMAKALIGHIEGITSGHSGNYKIGSMADGQMSKIDVVITDTSGPVYLVLQDFAARTIWNLHLGEGVNLAHVVLIGETPAVAGLPEGAGLEALRISDFVERFEFGSNDKIEPCMVAPWRVPREDWLGLQKAKGGNQLFENQMYSYNAGARAFAAWYAEALAGWTPFENLVAVNQTAHVLAGPVPSTPVPYTPLQTRKAHILNTDHLVIGEDALRSLHDTTLEAAIGGSVAMLDPAPLQLGGQEQ
ncbi:MAG: hypothetical protein AAGA38_09755 [Pseudomonadota bacterium]